MKKYFKKGLSLMMAALMLLSCWVFFAPEAEAVGSGDYSVKLYANVTDDADYVDENWTIYGKANNGKGS